MAAPLTLVIIALTIALAGGVWVGLSLIGVGVVALETFRTMPVDRFLAQDAWNTLTSPELIALPMFILMGELLFHTRLSSQVFSGLVPWINRLPGRLLHVNVLACTMFAAASGSSAATIGRITLAELERRGYSRRLSMGSLAGAGTLGLLIPPSIIMIIYGVLTKVSILQLFLAGVAPGLMLSFGFMLFIAAAAIVDPTVAPTTVERATWRERIRALGQLASMVFLIVVVLGSMYGGIAGPTEAAVTGVLGAVIIAALQRVLSLRVLWQSALGTIRTCSMIGIILVAGLFLAKAMAFLGLPRAVAEFIAAQELGPWALIGVLLAFYILLGAALDGLSCIVMTLPITFPLVTAAGFDPIWFGIFLVLVVEMAEISPPIGFNLFIVQNLTRATVGEVSWAALPFFLIMAVLVLVLTAFPEITTFASGTAGPQI
jgi:tripartite ATP-independent transporter DctM subunit